MTKSGHPIGRFLSEFAVIVVGVLLALAVDRWIATIDQHERETAYLSSLRADFEANRRAAQDKLEGEAQLQELGNWLLQLLAAGSDDDMPERVVLAAELSGYVHRISYARGAWDAMNSTGGSLILNAPEVRIAVSNFYSGSEVREGLESEFLDYILTYRYAERPMVPPLVRTELNAAFGGWTGDFASRSLSYLDEVDLSSVAQNIRESPDLAVPLADVVMARGVSVLIAGEEMGEIDAIVEMIDQALGAL